MWYQNAPSCHRALCTHLAHTCNKEKTVSIKRQAHVMCGSTHSQPQPLTPNGKALVPLSFGWIVIGATQFVRNHQLQQLSMSTITDLYSHISQSPALLQSSILWPQSPTCQDILPSSRLNYNQQDSMGDEQLRWATFTNAPLPWLNSCLAAGN